MIYLHAYIAAFTLFWAVYTTSALLWALQRHRETSENIRARLVIE